MTQGVSSETVSEGNAHHPPKWPPRQRMTLPPHGSNMRTLSKSLGEYPPQLLGRVNQHSVVTSFSLIERREYTDPGRIERERESEERKKKEESGARTDL